MSEINSPLGRMKLAQGKGPKVLTVPDESGYGEEEFQSVNPYAQQAAQPVPMRHQAEPHRMTEEEANEFARVRKEQRAAASKLSPLARERVEVLIGLNRLKSEVEVDGIKFGLRSLKASEMREIMMLGAQAMTRQERYFVLRDQTLARALVSVDGQDVKMVLGTPDKDAVIELLDQMEHSVVDKIFDHYEEMVRKNHSKLTVADKEDGAQLGEDIKKS